MKICPVGTELFHAGRTDRVTDTRKLIVLVFKLSPCCSNDKVSFSLHHLLKMEPTQCSETSAFNTQTPGEYPEGNLSLLQHGESLKTRHDIADLCFSQFFAIASKNHSNYVTLYESSLVFDA